jgi:hypothetical protein
MLSRTESKDADSIQADLRKQTGCEDVLEEFGYDAHLAHTHDTSAERNPN